MARTAPKQQTEKASHKSTFECPIAQIYANPVTLHNVHQSLSRFNLSNSTSIAMLNTPSLSNPDKKRRERDADKTAPPARTTGKRKEAIYVYDHSRNKISRIEDGEAFKKQFGKHRQDCCQVTISKNQLGRRPKTPGSAYTSETWAMSDLCPGVGKRRRICKNQCRTSISAFDSSTKCFVCGWISSSRALISSLRYLRRVSAARRGVVNCLS